MVNGSTRNQGGKDQMTTEQSMGEKKQPRPDYKEKRNNLDRIDLSNTASKNLLVFSFLKIVVCL